MTSPTAYESWRALFTATMTMRERLRLAAWLRGADLDRALLGSVLSRRELDRPVTRARA